MTAMLEALLKAKKINEDDVRRVEKQEREEQKKKFDYKDPGRKLSKEEIDKDYDYLSNKSKS